MRDKGQANERAAEEARLQQMRALESLKRLGGQRNNESNDSGVFKDNSRTDETM